MKPDSKKNGKMLEEFPFIGRSILSMAVEPWDDEDVLRVDSLAIHVEKADRDLMYRCADNVGLGESSYCFSMKKEREEQVMRQGEFVLAVDKNGIVINHLFWPKNREEARGKKTPYVKQVFFVHDSSRNPDSGIAIFDRVKYLVWVRVEAWHTDTRQDDFDRPGARFGELRERIFDVTVYKEPECGFRDLVRNSSKAENLYLDSHTFIKAFHEKDEEIIAISGRLDELCRQFQDEVYFDGMKELRESGEFRGASARAGATKVLCTEMCGYDRVMLEDDQSWISFQLRPEADAMYVLGSGGTLPRIRNLVRTVIKAWRNPESELRKSFASDQHVYVM